MDCLPNGDSTIFRIKRVVRGTSFVAGIRTVIVTTPAMLGDLVKRLALGRVELDVVAELGTRRALARRLPELRPDLVVIGLHRRESDGIVTTLLMQLPKAKFIVFSADARTVIGYELRLHKAALSEMSPDGFIGFMRRTEPTLRETSPRSSGRPDLQRC
jgi:hypothetical protein